MASGLVLLMEFLSVQTGVSLHLHLFLVLILGAFPSACLFCPILLCSFLFILLLSLRRPFSNERQKGGESEWGGR